MTQGAHLNVTNTVQESRLAEALATAVSRMPANEPMQQVLRHHLALYTKLLLEKLSELQTEQTVDEDRVTKKQKTALSNTPEARCLSVLCHR